MKKVLSLILCVLILAGTLCSCGKSESNEAAYDTVMPAEAPAAAPAEMKPEAEMVWTEEAGYSEYDYEVAAEEPAAGGGIATVVSELTRVNNLSDKIIYRADAYIETVEFDKSVEGVYALITNFGGFIENSYISGADYRTEYYGYQTYRNANFTVRVPKESFAGLTESLTTLGNVTSIYSSAENITQQYTDAQARLETYEAEEKRLIEMMDAAVTVEDLISIEARLSEVRYNIESITTTLRNWQNEIDYSTVSIGLQEVAEIKEAAPINRTFGEELRDGLKDTFRAIGRFFKNLVRWFIVNLPTIILIVVVIAVIVLIIRRTASHRSERRAKREAKRLARRAGKASKTAKEKTESAPVSTELPKQTDRDDK